MRYSRGVSGYKARKVNERELFNAEKESRTNPENSVIGIIASTDYSVRTDQTRWVPFIPERSRVSRYTCEQPGRTESYMHQRPILYLEMKRVGCGETFVDLRMQTGYRCWRTSHVGRQRFGLGGDLFQGAICTSCCINILIS